MTRPGKSPQIAEALADLGWKGDGPVFGDTAAPAAAAAAAAAAEPRVLGELLVRPRGAAVQYAGEDGREGQEWLSELSALKEPDCAMIDCLYESVRLRQEAR
jgi:hypothetical protein